jgi:guanylate kinase
MTDPHPFPGFPPPAPLVLVLSGPSGVGKTVICRSLVEADPGLVLSISVTTRAPRGTERDRVDYRFLSEAGFRDEIARGLFLEWAEVHGCLYGTPRTFLEEAMRNGRSPVLDVDVQGGRSVKKLLPDAVLILVAPPSLDALRERLRGRGTEREEAIDKRLAVASRELEEWRHYDYVLINDRLERAVAEVQAILTAERARVSRRLSPGDPPPARG